MTTFIPKADGLERKWFVIDAKGQVLGKLATRAAVLLTGKHKPIYTPNLDTGDHVVVINASKVVFTGKKLQNKIYRRHTGFPGGLREITAEKRLAKEPDRLIEDTVWGMLPKGSLGRQMYRKLKVYAGKDHPHAAQKPRPLSVRGAHAAAKPR
jgi:large subunit ribosomal protein L13